MKTILAISLILLSTVCSAQIVNIPDPNFKQALLDYFPAIDTNEDGEIQVSEAADVISLAVTQKNISDLTGIQSFFNLQHLSCEENQIESLDLSNLPNLLSIFANDNLINNLNLSGCINLEQLDCGYNQIGILDLSNLTNLFSVFAPTSQITSVVLTGCTRLQSLYLFQNRLSSIDLTGLPPGTVDLSGSQTFISEIIAENSSCVLRLGSDSIGYINLRNYQRESLDFAMALYIQKLDISNSQSKDLWDAGTVENLIAVGCDQLKFIHTVQGGPSISRWIDLTGSPNLSEIQLTGGITAVDLSGCLNLREFAWYNSKTGPKYLNLKNGSLADLVQIESIFSLPVDSLYICADDFEIASLTDIFSVNSGSEIVINDVCSFFPGGNYNTIRGKARLDITGIGCNQSNPGLNQVPIRVDDGTNTVTRFTTGQGDFRHYPYAGNFTLTSYFPQPYFNVTPAAAIINFDTANSLIDSVNFCIRANGVHNDLEITILPVTPARPGFDVVHQLVYKNRGTTIQSGSVQFNYDNSKLNFISGSTNPTTQIGGQLTWNYNNLQPFEQRTINVTFSLFPPPVNNIYDTLFYLTTVNPTNGDETPSDNSFVLPQAILGSFDPNDKTCLQGNALSATSIDKPLDFLIRFQNLGTDTAFNVVVVDTLSDRFDLNSLEIVSTTHPCEIELKNNKLQFYFQDIRLPYATINEPASHGFVAFKIKPRPNVIIGDSLNNKASIYFDFNLPVVTNTTTTIVAEPSGPVPVKLEYFSLRSKPSGNELTWKIATEDVNTNFSLERSGDGIHFTSIKNISASRDRCQVPFNFTDEKPLAGTNFYRLKITDADNKSFYSKRLQTGKTTSGVNLIAVTNDQAHSNLYLNASEPQSVHVKIIAADGRLVLSENRKLLVGNNRLIFQTADFAKGVYSIILYTETEMLTKRFIK